MKNKLIVIKKGELFYNAEKKVYSDKLHLCSWYRNINVAERVINILKLEGANVDYIKEDEFLTAGADSTTRAILICDLAQQYIKENLDIIPAVTTDAKHLRNSLNNSLGKLKIIHPYIKEVEEEKENEFYAASGLLDELVRRLSKMDFQDYENMIHIMDAYKKSPASIGVLTRKILKIN